MPAAYDALEHGRCSETGGSGTLFCVPGKNGMNAIPCGMVYERGVLAIVDLTLVGHLADVFHIVQHPIDVGGGGRGKQGQRGGMTGE